MDSYGDGLTGDPSCSPDGSLQIDIGNDSLTGIAQADANFGTQAQLSFCVEQNSISDKEFGSLIIFPNPTKEFFILTWPKNQIEDVEVYSLFGQLLIKEDVNGEEIKIKTENLASGAYLIRINSDGRSIIKRLVIN
jgi:hypothetical protein